MKRKPKPKPKPSPRDRTYNFYLDKKKQAWCFRSENARCFIMPSGLVAPAQATPAHDEALMRCTNEINAILRKVTERKSGEDAELHLLKTHRGFLLAWAHCLCDGVSGEDDPAAIDKAFGIE